MRSRWSDSWSHFKKSEANPDDVIISNVRLQSNAGWYLGSVEFYNFDEMDYYSRDTDFYYPNEELLKKDYPLSISLKEAHDKIHFSELYRRKLSKKLKNTNK